MRILIAGAGIGGLTLAALLERFGHRPTVVERAPSFEHAGYMLGLWPLGSRVLRALGLFEGFERIGVPVRLYHVHDGRGRLIKDFDMKSLTDRFGPILDTTRPQLVELLRSAVQVPIRFGTAVEAVEPDGALVHVTLGDGTRETFDLVVGADGIHSRIRRCLFGEQPIYDTRWGGWMWWAPATVMPEELTVELWGAGRLLGAYPTRRGVGVFACAPVEGGFDQAGPGRRERVRAVFAGMGPLVDTLLEAFPPDDAETFFWRLADVRSREWVRGRVVLLGDAAAGFLPTAGVGASMAMESAAVLADELSRADPARLEQALALYVKRRRRRVEAVQRDSRRLAWVMFLRNPVLAKLRDLGTRFATVEGFVSAIARALEEPI